MAENIHSLRRPIRRAEAVDFRMEESSEISKICRNHENQILNDRTKEEACSMHQIHLRQVASTSRLTIKSWTRRCHIFVAEVIRNSTTPTLGTRRQQEALWKGENDSDIAHKICRTTEIDAGKAGMPCSDLVSLMLCCLGLGRAEKAQHLYSVSISR